MIPDMNEITIVEYFWSAVHTIPDAAFCFKLLAIKQEIVIKGHSSVKSVTLRTYNKIDKLFYHPVIDGAGVCIEVNACLHYALIICLIGNGIAFLIDLIQCRPGRAVCLQFQYIGGVGH